MLLTFQLFTQFKPRFQLKFAFQESINLCLKRGLGNCIPITKFGARWVDDQKNYNIVFEKANLKLVINYLINNYYFTVGMSAFKQVIGIPMGSDPALFKAILFLYYFENKWILIIKKQNLNEVPSFVNTFRSINDLIAINDNGLLE